MFSTSVPSLFTSFAAGLLSFLSPCVLPLIPVYLSFITGESTEDLKEGRVAKSAVLFRTTSFVLGFTIVFVALALIFGGGMKMLGSGLDVVINRVAGVIILILAANFAFDFIPFLRMELRGSVGAKPGSASADSADASGSRSSKEHFNATLIGSLKSFLLGVSFAAGWTPCIGPILSSLLLYAGSSGNVGHSMLLLSLYSVGFALPFFVFGLFFGRLLPVLNWFKKHMKAIKIISALLLFFFGLAMLTGSLGNLPALIVKTGYWFQELAETGPAWFRPLARFLSAWFLF